jgi:hypothetical protein
MERPESVNSLYIEWRGSVSALDIELCLPMGFQLMLLEVERHLAARWSNCWGGFSGYHLGHQARFSSPALHPLLGPASRGHQSDLSKL